MKITVIAVGHARGGPEAALAAEYLKRLPWAGKVIEVEEKRPLPPLKRMKSEGEKLLKEVPKGAFLIALDKAGTAFSSQAFAEKLETWFSAGGSQIAFVIGGAEGLSSAVLEKARARLSLGSMTWPHLLARAMLMEQLYRAWAIREGHPYHK